MLQKIQIETFVIRTAELDQWRQPSHWFLRRKASLWVACDPICQAYAINRNRLPLFLEKEGNVRCSATRPASLGGCSGTRAYRYSTWVCRSYPAPGDTRRIQHCYEEPPPQKIAQGILDRTQLPTGAAINQLCTTAEAACVVYYSK